MSSFTTAATAATHTRCPHGIRSSEHAAVKQVPYRTSGTVRHHLAVILHDHPKTPQASSSRLICRSTLASFQLTVTSHHCVPAQTFRITSSSELTLHPPGRSGRPNSCRVNFRYDPRRIDPLLDSCQHARTRRSQPNQRQAFRTTNPPMSLQLQQLASARSCPTERLHVIPGWSLLVDGPTTWSAHALHMGGNAPGPLTHAMHQSFFVDLQVRTSSPDGDQACPCFTSGERSQRLSWTTVPDISLTSSLLAPTAGAERLLFPRSALR